ESTAAISPKGCYGILDRNSESVRLDVGRPDHLAPLFGLLLKPPPVIRGRAAGDAAAQVSKPQLQFAVRQRGVNLVVQFVDDLKGCVLGCANAYPRSRIVTRQKLTQRWDLRQDLRARRSGNRQCAHFAGLDVLNGRSGEHHLYLATYEVGKRRLSAAIGDMH